MGIGGGDHLPLGLWFGVQCAAVGDGKEPQGRGEYFTGL
jgi:hypothetical protein